MNTDTPTTTPAHATALAQQTAQQRTQKRTWQLRIFAALCLLGAVAYGLYWLRVARFEVLTDNAYVQGNVVQITPQVSGTVVAIAADDTDQVALGQVLVKLDPLDAHVALEQAAAQLAQTVRDVRALYANGKTLAAHVAAGVAGLERSRAELQRVQADLARRDGLLSDGAVSGEDVQHLQTAVRDARAARRVAAAELRAARAQLAQNHTLTDDTSIASHPRVQAAATAYRAAWLAYQRLTIVAPVAGTVARRSVQLGQRVSSGMPLMALIPLQQLWVEANFKESQLAALRIGQPAQLTADVYGQRIDYHGRVVGLGAGTGAAFALLPAQNATGNWIKVVQRVPVRIALNPAEIAAHPLRVGLSMEVTVDTHDPSGTPVHGTPSIGAAAAAAPASSTSSTTVFDDLERTSAARIQAIIAANLGSPQRPQPE